MNLGLIAGVVLLLAAGALTLRELLLSPHERRWPDASTWVLGFMFAHITVLVYAGFALALNHTIQRLVQSPLLVVVLVSYLVLECAMTANVLRQRLTVDTWDRIKRVNYLAFCRDGFAAARTQALAALRPGVTPGSRMPAREAHGAIARLKIEGATVSGPDESAEHYASRP